MKKILFSKEGRISRKHFWISVFGLYVFFVIGIFLITPMVGKNIAILIFFVASLYPTFCVYSKRLQDRNKPALPIALLFVGLPAIYSLLFQFNIGFSIIQIDVNTFVPVPISFAWLSQLILLVVGIWAIIECGCKKGTHGSNRFGNDPLQSKMTEETKELAVWGRKNVKLHPLTAKEMLHENVGLSVITASLFVIVPILNYISTPPYAPKDDKRLNSLASLRAPCPAEDDTYNGIVLERELSNGLKRFYSHRRISESLVWTSLPLHDSAHRISYRGLLPLNSIRYSGTGHRTVRYKTSIDEIFPISEDLDTNLEISIINKEENPYDYQNKSHLKVVGFEDYRVGGCNYPVIRIRQVDIGPRRDGTTSVSKSEYLYSPELSVVLKGGSIRSPYTNIRKRQFGDKFLKSNIQNRKNTIYDFIFDLNVENKISEFLLNVRDKKYASKLRRQKENKVISKKAPRLDSTTKAIAKSNHQPDSVKLNSLKLSKVRKIGPIELTANPKGKGVLIANIHGNQSDFRADTNDSLDVYASVGHKVTHIEYIQLGSLDDVDRALTEFREKNFKTLSLTLYLGENYGRKAVDISVPFE